MMTKKRVVITGLGGVSPIGNTLESVKTSKCGIDEISKFSTENFEVKLAGEVVDLDIKEYLDRKSIKRMDNVSIFALIAAMKAVENSGLDLKNLNKDRAGVYISSGIGGLETIEKQHSRGLKNGFEKVSPFFIPMAIVNLTASHVASCFGFNGSCICPVTACAGSNTAIGEAFRRVGTRFKERCKDLWRSLRIWCNL